MASPRASSAGDLSGKDSPRPSRLPADLGLEAGSDEEERSTWDIRKTPRRLAKTPPSLRQVNFSVRVMAPMSRVQMLEVEVRIVVEATVVY